MPTSDSRGYHGTPAAGCGIGNDGAAIRDGAKHRPVRIQESVGIFRHEDGLAGLYVSSGRIQHLALHDRDHRFAHGRMKIVLLRGRYRKTAHKKSSSVVPENR